MSTYCNSNNYNGLFLLSLLLSCLLLVLARGDAQSLSPYSHEGQDTTRDFSNEWVVNMEGSEDSAELIALKLGYEYLGQLRGFPDHYLMRKLDHPEESDRDSPMHTRGLEDEVRVVWAQQLFSKLRVKRRPAVDPGAAELVRARRSVTDAEEERFLFHVRRMASEEVQVEEDQFRELLRILKEEDERGIPSELLQLWKEENEKHADRLPLRRDDFFNDELWDHQWYMVSEN